MIDNGNGIYTLDSHYFRDNLAAVYLIREGNEVALIETANAKSLPVVIAALHELGLTEATVKYIFLTHIHLDHAGGAGAYMEAFPNAKLVVHPKGARHMINPAVLEAGATVVYGEEFMTEMYGKLLPIETERIIIAKDNLSITLGERQFICRDTPGHANHHNIIFDTKSQGVFSGDVFGIGYPELNVAGNVLVFPSTTPVNFDPEKMYQSIELILSYQPQSIFLTHFGRCDKPQELANQLLKMLPNYIRIAKQFANLANSETEITAALNYSFIQEAREFGVKLSDSEIIACVGLDMQINAQGLVVWLSQAKNV